MPPCERKGVIMRLADERLRELRREVEQCEDREQARRLYDQLRDLSARLARKFSFKARRKSSAK